MKTRLILNDVWLRYPTVTSQHRRLLTPSTWRGAEGGELRWTLQGVNLRLESGDRVALIGRNGAGKTTLLRILAGVFAPQKGHYEREGRIGCLLDTGYGLDLNVSARTNAVSRGILMGLSRSESRSQAEAALDFAGLEDVADQPVRTYSTGMAARLVFAMSTQYDHDILILDEAIGAGDAAFQTKAKDRIASILESASIVICASHSRSFLETFCTEAILLEDRGIAARGPFSEIQDRYENSFL